MPILVVLPIKFNLSVGTEVELSNNFGGCDGFYVIPTLVLKSFLAAIFYSFPNSIFAQNNGIIQLTGVASRYVGYYIAGMLILLGLFPIVRSYFPFDALPCALP